MKITASGSNQKIAIDPEYFHRLSKGQEPRILNLGCADSRVIAEQLMGVEPGEVFVHRNMVPNTDLSATSVMNYDCRVSKQR